MSSESNTSNSSANKQSKQSRREEVNKALCSACDFVSQSLSQMIDQAAVDKVATVSSKTRGRLPKELNFKVFDIERKLLIHLGVLRKEGGKVIFDQSGLPFHTDRGVKGGPPGFSWKTIYNREFVSKKKVKGISGEESTVDVRSNSRFQSAGITTFLAIDVKRLLNPKGIKVIDVSDNTKSTKTVYQITVFPLEENYKSTHGSPGTPFKKEFVNDMLPETPSAPVKEGIWVKAVKGTMDEVKENLDAKLEAVSAAVAADEEQNEQVVSETVSSSDATNVDTTNVDTTNVDATNVDTKPQVEEQISAE